MPHNLTRPLTELSHLLANGQCTARSLVEAALTRIAAVNDPERPVFLVLYSDQALAKADEIDRARSLGTNLPAFSGIPFAAKDLFDVAGEVTTAGSIVLKNAAPAKQHASVVQRLVDAGMILIGKTNMTEFAFSGLGLNPHYGTPPAWGTAGDTACAPGGSSSGAGVSIAAGMVPVSLGTDTAGSCRIPAAWNGVVGYKPTQSSLPGDGAFPLSELFDAPGPFTHRVSCCHSVFQMMAGQDQSSLPVIELAELSFAVPTGLALSDLNPMVEAAFNRTLKLLESSGAAVDYIDVPEFETAGDVFRSAPMASRQAWEIHRERLETHREMFDPFVAMRVSNGKNISDDTQNANLAKRKKAILSFTQRMKIYDALLMPTTADLPPLLAPLQYDLDVFAATNGRALRNTSLTNFVDGCAISIPCQRGDEPAIGFSLCQANSEDQRLFVAAQAIEKMLGR